MKDFDMTKPQDMTTQELEDDIERLYDRLIRLTGEAVSRTCVAAASDPDGYGYVNAHMENANGLLRQSKASATLAGLAMPEITVRFGGK